MRTLFTRGGNEVTFVHDVDAREALERGSAFEEKLRKAPKPKKKLNIRNRKPKVSRAKTEVVEDENEPLIVDE